MNFSERNQKYRFYDRLHHLIATWFRCRAVPKLCSNSCPEYETSKNFHIFSKFSKCEVSWSKRNRSVGHRCMAGSRTTSFTLKHEATLTIALQDGLPEN